MLEQLVNCFSQALEGTLSDFSFCVIFYSLKLNKAVYTANKYSFAGGQYFGKAGAVIQVGRGSIYVGQKHPHLPKELLNKDLKICLFMLSSYLHLHAHLQAF